MIRETAFFLQDGSDADPAEIKSGKNHKRILPRIISWEYLSGSTEGQ